MAILNPKEEQTIADDVQYQARNYWHPILDSDEWALLNGKLAKEIGEPSNYLDEATKWLYATEKGIEVFALYGIGDGTVATPLYASSGKQANKDVSMLKEYLGGYKHDYSGDTVNAWFEAISSAKREYYAGYDADGHRRKALGLDNILSKQAERLGRGNNGGGTEDSEDITQYQQRTKTLTDREILSIAASEINIEGLTDGKISTLGIFNESLTNLYELEQKKSSL